MLLAVNVLKGDFIQSPAGPVLLTQKLYCCEIRNHERVLICQLLKNNLSGRILEPGHRWPRRCRWDRLACMSTVSCNKLIRVVDDSGIQRPLASSSRVGSKFRDCRQHALIKFLWLRLTFLHTYQDFCRKYN